VPHHLLDVLDVTEEASVADFQRAARTSFAEIRSRGRVPVLVGGSGLYVRAALDVLELPGTDPAVRARIEGDLAQRGPGALRERLRQVDPESAARLQDERRLVRALEVWELTGRPFTSFMPRREHVEPTVQIGLDVERAELHDRLARRVGVMVEAGLEAEVRALATRGLREGRTASRALGYGQFLDVVDGRATVEEAVGATVVATRRFARRQLTWFRADPRVHWLDPSAPGLVERAVRLVERAAD
jgi:tRNA dimethylallyltransferase